ncbi:hypothetical protein [Streptomonospora salina]|uniref:Uncharacterized protein n=1 Tax=Streptomonospora salina TaxID=104205 RepID=A0A841EJR5_9ACTN|nr:hypothetical protein [Streptomonospora salina]MBB5999661.1 hypothetical protein [Streptomonospora salina]
MSGLSIMCDSDIENADTGDIHLFDAEALTIAQLVGEACAVCHARWPRPRHRIGASSEDDELFGCRECAEIAADHDSGASQRALVAR